jgi:hypothetical protein
MEQRHRLFLHLAQNGVVLQQLVIDLRQAVEDLGIRGHDLARADEGLHQKMAHLHYSRTLQHRASHEHAVLGENPDRLAAATVQT